MASPDYIARLFQIESGGDPNAVTGSNRGLGQFSPDLERQYGITDANRGDPGAQAAAVRAEADAHTAALGQVLGRDPTDAELYLAHQQGLGGATAHLTNPEQPAWMSMAGTGEGRQKGERWAKAAIWGNMTPQMKAQFPGGVDSVTSGDFTRLWADRFGGAPAATQTAASAPAVAGPSSLGLLPNANPAPPAGLLGQQPQQQSPGLNVASMGAPEQSQQQQMAAQSVLPALPHRRIDLSKLQAMLRRA